MFIDEATITAQAGDGGNGCCSFRREKYIARGGPNGGDGGAGGSVVLVAAADVSTLLAYRYRNLFRAPRGRHGEGSDRTGRSGEDLELRVPVGTVVRDLERVHVLADLTRADDRYVAARGGRGGRGNARFKNSRNQAPTRADAGASGEIVTLRLELKLLADVGLLGFPNAGKSTLISRISAAHPKIADYPFTTLEPHLGVVDRGDFRSFVVADIPGLVEGASEGAGLGHRFLRHVERCRLLLHLVDPSGTERDPLVGVDRLNRELRRYGETLEHKPQILVLTKNDVVQDKSVVSRLEELGARRGIPVVRISAVRGEGLKGLIGVIGRALDDLDAPGAGRRR